MAVTWYLLPTLVLGIIAFKFPFVLLVAIPAQTSWVATVGLLVPRKICPESMWLLEQNMLNVDHLKQSLRGE